MNNNINLIPAWRREQRKLRARRKLWAIGASAYAVVLLVVYCGWRFAWRDDGRDIASRLTTAKADVDTATAELNRLRASMQSAQRSLRVGQSILGQPDWSVLLALAGRLRGDDVVLSRCDLDATLQPLAQAAPVAAGATPVAVAQVMPGQWAGPLLFHLQGYGKTQAAVSQYALRLEGTGLFQNVSLVKSNREPFLASEAVAFRIECAIKPDAPQGSNSKQAKRAPSVASVEGSSR
jgi:hypothetical protein